MTSPLIGITTTHIILKSPLPSAGISEAYIQAVRRAGGTPVLIPPGLKGAELETLRSRLDGILLTGGSDVDPARYNGLPHPRVYGVDRERDTLEIDIVRMAADSAWPFLGICRGIQVINVALGGTLYTDIHDQRPEAQRHDWFPRFRRDRLAHTVKVDPGSRLGKILGAASVQTNSLHHQAVAQVAAPLRQVASAPDGIVEAVELPGHPFGVAVQWHPEWLQDNPQMRSLFTALVDAARRQTA
jgi:putative glutamine amidotransferase